eukprot:scaffold22694_cov61-Phaeocystis_antarctica.AAC.1
MARPILAADAAITHPGVEVKFRRGDARLLARAGRARSEDDEPLDGADAALLTEDVPAALLELGLEQRRVLREPLAAHDRDRLQPWVRVRAS